MYTHLAWMTHLGRSLESGGHATAMQPAAEGFVMFTLATLFFTLGCFVTWMWFIWRRGRNPPPHIRLIMELADDEEREKLTAARSGAPAEEKQPWERDADWWRKTGDGGPPNP
ncbi:MAG: hypothetical protein IPK32_02145 [Verrucomicrobiaceae bacterium]|nr:hypothetical protein [Verrucomicrobiaceae bacterium]